MNWSATGATLTSAGSSGRRTASGTVDSTAALEKFLRLVFGY